MRARRIWPNELCIIWDGKAYVWRMRDEIYEDTDRVLCPHCQSDSDSLTNAEPQHTTASTSREFFRKAVEEGEFVNCAYCDGPLQIVGINPLEIGVFEEEEESL